MSIMGEETQKLQRKTFSWRWVLLGLAIALTAVWLSLTPEGLLGKAHAIGYSVCHQIVGRSFEIFGQAFPICARCTGMFAGAMLGLVYQIAQGRKGKMPPVPVMILLGLMVLAWVLDGTNSFTMLIPGFSSVYATQNWTRLVTGTGMGLALSSILVPAFIQTVFVRWDEESALGNWKQVLGLLALAAVLDFLILLENSWILYPIALISTAGVVVLLTIVYTMVLVLLTKKDNTFPQINSLINYLIGGYMIALMQISAIDLLRYLWTGTWAGFIL